MDIELNLDIVENLADPFENPEKSFINKEDDNIIKRSLREF